GTTEQGGADGDGVVFKLSPSGNNWTESVLHAFDNLHGGSPNAALILQKQVLYGTAGYGGKDFDGVVFSITAGRGRSVSTQERLRGTVEGNPRLLKLTNNFSYNSK